MPIKINQLTNANIYANGNSYLGTIKEFAYEDPKFMTADHTAIGLFGKLEYPTGMDKMTGSFTWAAIYTDKVNFANPFSFVKVQIRGNLETYNSTGRAAQVPYEVDLIIGPTNLPGGDFKQHENVEGKQSFNIYYMKEQINGQNITEIDVQNNIFSVNGVDQLTQYRANLGV